MYKVLTYNKISEAGLRKLKPENYLVADDIADPDAILVRSAPLNDMQFGPSLKVIARVGAGFNTIPVDRCTESGICVFNTPGGNANAVRELTICGMLTACRNVEKATKWLKSLPAAESQYGGIVESGKEVFKGPEILGKTIGVIGLGAVGSRVAISCHKLGMEVIGYDPYLSHVRLLELKQDMRIVENLDELLAESDFISIHTPLNQETRGMLSREAIRKMKDGVYLMNYARGPVVDNEAVCDALDSGKIAAYATDFPTEAQLKREDVVSTPHLGAGTPEAEENCAIMAARQTRDYLENGNTLHSVNFPDVSFQRAEGDRITVLHKNKVGMLGLITDRAAGMNLNIENLINKAKGDVAYTILDFNDVVPDALADALSDIDGVIKVRVIH